MPIRAFFPDLLAVHLKMQELVSALQIESEPEAAAPLVEQLLRILAPHIVAEDQVIFPRLIERLQEEDDRVTLLESHLDHGEIWNLAKRVHQAPPGSEAAKAAARALDKFLSKHIQEEEDDILFMAHKVLPYQEFSRLAREVQRRQKELMEYAERRLLGEKEDLAEVLSEELMKERSTRAPWT